MPKSRVALFVDAENFSAKYLTDCIEYCGKFGKLTIKRCYGREEKLKEWEEVISGNFLIPMLTPPFANKENASDFALTIDAVSLLHRDQFDDAVIASSDADFTLLAIHIREHGKGIYGAVEKKASAMFKSCFDDYTIVPTSSASKLPKLAFVAAAPAKAIKAVQNKLNALKPVVQIPEKQLRTTVEKRLKIGPASLKQISDTFRADFPEIQVVSGKGKFKKMLINIGFSVDDKQIVTRN